MNPGALLMLGVIVVTAATVGWLVVALVRSIAVERRAGRGVWRDFGLGLGLMTLFFVSWLAHGVSQWQTFTDEQRSLGQRVGLGDFAAEFAQSTLENWQSEFLQLFSFVVLAALYVHRGSAESKDADERMEASLRRIEQHLGTLPSSAPVGADRSWELPDPPAS